MAGRRLAIALLGGQRAVCWAWRRRPEKKRQAQAANHEGRGVAAAAEGGRALAEWLAAAHKKKSLSPSLLLRLCVGCRF